MECSAISDSPSEILSPLNFPSDVLKWMKLNAKPKMALKLMKVCKYFRHSDGFPYLVVNNVFGGFQWILSTLDEITISTENLETIPKKLWFIQNINIYGGPKNVPTFFSKTVVCDIQKLVLSSQQMTLDEFKFLTNGGMVEECVLIKTTIVSGNGKIVPLEDIFECLPNVRIIDFKLKVPSLFSLEAAEANISSKLEKIKLWIPPNSFNLQLLFAYMKNHQKIQYELGFPKHEYAENTAPFANAFALLNKMIQEWSPKYKKPKVSEYLLNLAFMLL